MPHATPARKPDGVSTALALLVILVIGTALRAIAAHSTPWLDEIWSWRFARDNDVFLEHDNNHILNTLWLWFLGDTTSAPVWRLPAVMFGGASIAMVFTLVRRLGRPHALFAAALVACSYPFVVYQSEARGYSLMILCVLLALEVQMRLIDARNAKPNVTDRIRDHEIFRAFCKNVRNRVDRLRGAMAFACAVGVLSHASFAGFYAILIAFAVIRAFVTRGNVRGAIADHALSTSILITWYAGFYRLIEIGGGPASNPWATLAESIGVSTLGLQAPVSLIAGLALAAAIVGLAIFAIRGEQEEKWHGRLAHAQPPQRENASSAVSDSVLRMGETPMPLSSNRSNLVSALGAVALIYPIAIAATGDTLIFVRYFLPGMLALTLLAGALLGELWQRGRFRFAAAATLALAMVAQIRPMVPLLEDGRDGHADAIALMAKTPGVTLASENDFQLRMILDYYTAAGVISGEKIVKPGDQPEWLVVMRPANRHDLMVAGTAYSLESVYPANSWSGIPWQLYHRRGQTVASAK